MIILCVYSQKKNFLLENGLQHTFNKYNTMINEY